MTILQRTAPLPIEEKETEQLQEMLNLEDE